MNAGFVTCCCLSFCFLIFAFIFQLLKARATILISGFNCKTKAERARYDELRISIDYRNMFLLWTFILGIGAVLAYYIASYMAIIAVIVWFIVFVKEVHLDVDKAFSKYKIK